MDSDESTSGQPGGAMPTSIPFHYIKSNHFRVVYVSGVLGGVGPGGHIEMNVYAERRPIPRRTVHALKSDGTLGDEDREARLSREGLVREVEVGAVMDLPTAQSLHKWLGEKIEELIRIESRVQERKGNR